MTDTPLPAQDILGRYRPADYVEAARNCVAVDGVQAALIRYQRADGRNAFLGGEHFSAVIAEDGRLKGFARMDLDLLDAPLPAREEAEDVAMELLRAAAPDLLDVLAVSWIEPHDEPLRVEHGGGATDLRLSGMKVKMRNTDDGRWMWVIVGPGRQVLAFERDIVWITMPGRRKTEKWLHDSWLAERAPDAPTF